MTLMTPQEALLFNLSEGVIFLATLTYIAVVLAWAIGPLSPLSRKRIKRALRLLILLSILLGPADHGCNGGRRAEPLSNQSSLAQVHTPPNTPPN